MGYVCQYESLTLPLTTTAEFNVDDVHDIDWNTDCFDTLVLPDGYKDLVLAHVENQLKGGETFDDVIHGKGLSLPFIRQHHLDAHVTFG